MRRSQIEVERTVPSSFPFVFHALFVCLLACFFSSVHVCTGSVKTSRRMRMSWLRGAKDAKSGDLCKYPK